MKILVLNGSPKIKSDTMVLTQAFLSGIKQTGEHEIDIVDIIKHRLSPCIGCLKCWHNGDGKCVIDDYQNIILDKIREADCIIWSFPLYCCGMPSHMKAVMDRMIPFNKMKANESNGRIDHNRIVDFSKKRYIAIIGSGFPLGEAKFDAIKMQCIHMFGKVRMICVPETPLLHVPSAEAYTKPLIEKFVAAGKEFGERTYLYGATVKALETPVMPNDQYVAFSESVEWGYDPDAVIPTIHK